MFNLISVPSLFSNLLLAAVATKILQRPLLNLQYDNIESPQSHALTIQHRFPCVDSFSFRVFVFVFCVSFRVLISFRFSLSNGVHQIKLNFLTYLHVDTTLKDLLFTW